MSKDQFTCPILLVFLWYCPRFPSYVSVHIKQWHSHIVLGYVESWKGKIILHKQRHHFQVDHTLSQFLNLLNRPSSDLILQVPIAPKSFSEPNGLSLCLPILPIQQAKVPKNHLQKKVFFHGEATEDSFLHLGSLHLHAIVLACTLLGRLKWSTHARINRSLTLQRTHDTQSIASASIFHRHNNQAHPTRWGCNWRAIIPSRS